MPKNMGFSRKILFMPLPWYLFLSLLHMPKCGAITIIYPFENITLVQGDSIYLTCNSTLESASIRWLHDGKLMLKQGLNHIISATGHLYMRDIRNGHSGHYNCLAVNETAKELSPAISVHVQVPVEIIEGPESRNVSFGHTITTYCVASGDPPPSLTWIRNGQIIYDNLTQTPYAQPKLMLNVTENIEISCHAYNTLVDGVHKALRSARLFSINAIERAKDDTILDFPTIPNFDPSLSHIFTKKETSLNETSITSEGIRADSKPYKKFNLHGEYFPSLSDIIIWTGVPLVLICTALSLFIVCKRWVIHKMNPFALHDSSGKTSHSNKSSSSMTTQDSLRIFISDLPSTDTYYNKIHNNTISITNQLFDRIPNCALSADSNRLSWMSKLFLWTPRKYSLGRQQHTIVEELNQNYSASSSHNTSLCTPNSGDSFALFTEYPRNNLIYVKDLGQGAYGRVFQARAPNLYRREPWTMVAVKMVKTQADLEKLLNVGNSNFPILNLQDLEEDFLREAKLMAVLHHPNIIKLLAVCSIGKPLCLLLEHMCYGDLNAFLKMYNPYGETHIQMIRNVAGDGDAQDLMNKSSVYDPTFARDLIQSQDHFIPYEVTLKRGNSRLRRKKSLRGSIGTAPQLNIFFLKQQHNYSNRNLMPDINNNTTFLPDTLTLNQDLAPPLSITTLDLLYMSRQIASGMLYLSTKQYIHRDLATRNCLVGPNLTIKISDFGLCRKIDPISCAMKHALTQSNRLNEKNDTQQQQYHFKRNHRNNNSNINTNVENNCFVNGNKSLFDGDTMRKGNRNSYFNYLGDFRTKVTHSRMFQSFSHNHNVSDNDPLYSSPASEFDYYRTMRIRAMAIPVRWMPPEAIAQSRFSTASDVWSLGVVLWEIFSFSIQPYAWLRNKTEILSYLQTGNRLPQPTVMPLAMYKSILLRCWKHDPQQRPSFKQILDMLNKLETQF